MRDFKFCIPAKVKSITYIGRQGSRLYHIYPVTRIETEYPENITVELMGNLRVDVGDEIRVYGYPRTVFLTSKKDAEMVENLTKGWIYRANSRLSRRFIKALINNLQVPIVSMNVDNDKVASLIREEFIKLLNNNGVEYNNLDILLYKNCVYVKGEFESYLNTARQNVLSGV